MRANPLITLKRPISVHTRHSGVWWRSIRDSAFYLTLYPLRGLEEALSFCKLAALANKNGAP